MKILITGVAGFIGYHLAKCLLDEKYEILGLDNLNNSYSRALKDSRLEGLKSFKNFTFNKIDICDKEELHNVFKLFKPQKVINLASQPGVRDSGTNPFMYFNSNLNGFNNVIEFSRAFEVECFLYASSSSVYGLNNKLPFNSDDIIKNPISLYGATKRSNELIANVYSEIYGLRTVGLRYFTVYGPFSRPDMAIFLFTKNIIEGKTIQVFNNGDMKRDFTYIDDIVSGTKSALEKNYKNEIFNLGNNKAEKLMDVISIIEEELGKKGVIEFQPKELSEILQTCADIRYSKQKLGYNPETNINLGIPKFIQWFKEYYNV